MHPLPAHAAPMIRALLASAAILGASPSLAAEPLTYPGAAQPQFKGYVRQAAYIPMPDGARLAGTYYLPEGAAAGARFPVVLWYIPGHRESIDRVSGKITSAFSAEDLAFFTSGGYALMVVEMRGSGASFGTRELDRGPQIGRDGKSVVDWIAAQPWSSGRVGMVGASYQGFSQYATAAEGPKALKGIFPEIAGFDDYNSMFHPGGILLHALSSFASNRISLEDQNVFDPKRGLFPSVPVVDEDGDGELLDEIPIDRNGDGSFLDDGAPAYKDGSKRQHLYYEATRQHLANANLEVADLQKARFRDSRLGASAYSFEDLGPGDRPARIAAAGIAVYNRGGWFDYHAKDAAFWQATLAGRAPTRLMMAPTGHGGFPTGGEANDGGGGRALYTAGPYFQFLGDRTSTAEGLRLEKLRFFDHYLKGLDNGFEKEPPVSIYVMGRGWRQEWEWPLKRAAPQTFHLGAGGALVGKPKAGQDAFTVDFTADSRSDGASRWNYGVTRAAKPLTQPSEDPKRLTYTSAALPADMEVTGHPRLRFTLSASVPHADVHAYLLDVAEDGSAYLVTEGQLRTSFHRDRPLSRLDAGGLKVKPALAWHGYRMADEAPAPLADGRKITVDLDLLPTAWVFKKGHKVRLALAGADFPTFEIHPGLSPANDPRQAAATGAAWTIHRGGPQGAALVLPVVPEGSHPARPVSR